AVLVDERHHASTHAHTRRLGTEQFDDAIAELMDVEVGRVDDDVGLGLDLFERAPFVFDRVDHALGHRERMRPPGVLVTAHEHAARGFEKHDAHEHATVTHRGQHGNHFVVTGSAEHDDHALVLAAG